MKKFTIKTDLFKDENELNIFVQNVRDMRDKQNAFLESQDNIKHAKRDSTREEFLLSQAVTEHLILTDAVGDYEEQVDRTLKSLPEVGAIFL